MPKCEVVYSHKPTKAKVSKTYPSYAAVARILKPGEDVTVQNKAGKFEGWFHSVGISKDDPKMYYVSRPQMEY